MKVNRNNIDYIKNYIITTIINSNESYSFIF